MAKTVGHRIGDLADPIALHGLVAADHLQVAYPRQARLQLPRGQGQVGRGLFTRTDDQ